MLIISLFSTLSSNVSGLTNIISSVLETFNATNDTRSISYFIFCLLAATGSLKSIIPMILKSDFELSSIEPSFYLWSNVYPVLNCLGIHILPCKRSLIIIESLASRNFASLLDYFDFKNNILIAMFYILDSVVSGLSHITYVAQ